MLAFVMNYYHGFVSVLFLNSQRRTHFYLSVCLVLSACVRAFLVVSFSLLLFFFVIRFLVAPWSWLSCSIRRIFYNYITEPNFFCSSLASHLVVARFCSSHTSYQCWPMFTFPMMNFWPACEHT